MRCLNSTRIRSDEGGFAIVEVLIGAIIMVLVSGAVAMAFIATGKSTQYERERARANSLAEKDLERTRSLRIADLDTLNSTPADTVTADGTTYSITSRMQYLTEAATTSTCASGTGSRDYLRLTSTVTWTGMGTHTPVTASTIVSPPSGSVVPNTGSLLVLLSDANNAPISGAVLTGSGAGSFNGTTGSSGCVLWRNLPAGTYQMAVSGTAAGMVDPNGDPPPGNTPTPSQTVSVVDQSTNTVNLQYDTPGALAVNFKTEPYGNGTPVNSKADGITVWNSGMQSAKTFTSSLLQTITTPSVLFPFASPSAYAVYAGTCASNNPDPAGDGSNAAAIGNVVVPAGGTGTLAPSYIKLPALHLTVYNGSSSSSQGTGISNATVTVKDLGTGCGGQTRTMTTTSGTTPGRLSDPGLPYSNYEVCASAVVSSQQRRNYVRVGSSKESVPVTNPNSGAVRAIYLGSSATGLSTGSGAVCP
jgi:Tfp pilus assembly protein PilV